jgi:hypothetical protein
LQYQVNARLFGFYASIVCTDVILRAEDLALPRRGLALCADVADAQRRLKELFRLAGDSTVSLLPVFVERPHPFEPSFELALDL